MKRVLSSVVAVAVATGVAFAPSAASAVTRTATDPTGDAATFEGAPGSSTPEQLVAGDVTGVKVEVKKKRVDVTVTGVDFPAAEEGLGLMTMVQFTNGPYAAGSIGLFYSAGDAFGIVPVGFTFDDGCKGKGTYDPAASTVSMVFPRKCFGSEKKVGAVEVTTSAYALTNSSTTPPTEDEVVTKGFRLPWAKGGKKKRPVR